MQSSATPLTEPVSTTFDIDAVIAAHKAWKSRLENVVLGIERHDLEVAAVVDDTRCRLGIWLHCENNRHVTWRHFKHLILFHREFHEMAGAILTLVSDGQPARAETLLNNDFARLSQQLVDLLTQLRVQCQSAGKPPHDSE